MTPVAFYPPNQMRYFDGYKRDDGRVGTRNYVAIISTGQLLGERQPVRQGASSGTSRQDFPNVDGVFAITHKAGLRHQLFGEDHRPLAAGAGRLRQASERRGLRPRRPRLRGEPGRSDLVERQDLVALGARPTPERKPSPVLNIQEQGGITQDGRGGRSRPSTSSCPSANACAAHRAAGLEARPGDELRRLRRQLRRHRQPGPRRRRPTCWCATAAPASSARRPRSTAPSTCSPAAPSAARSARSSSSAIKWWEWYAGVFGAEIDNNPSPGNKEGGLTTIYEKSLGAVAKGGTTPLIDVFHYAEAVTTKGFVFMDTPGYDPVSITGLVAGGCNVICFTTGRGSVFGCKPAPSIKIATNTPMYRTWTRTWTSTPA